jgi:ferritin-like protein
MSDLVEKEVDQLDEEMTPESIEEYYQLLRVMVEGMETDVLKSQKGNKSAATRLRKSLRLLKNKSGDFVKFTLGK